LFAYLESGSVEQERSLDFGKEDMLVGEKTRN